MLGLELDQQSSVTWTFNNLNCQRDPNQKERVGLVPTV
jgi:hypothetical protein